MTRGSDLKVSRDETLFWTKYKENTTQMVRNLYKKAGPNKTINIY